MKMKKTSALILVFAMAFVSVRAFADGVDDALVRSCTYSEGIISFNDTYTHAITDKVFTGVYCYASVDKGIIFEHFDGRYWTQFMIFNLGGNYDYKKSVKTAFSELLPEIPVQYVLTYLNIDNADYMVYSPLCDDEPAEGMTNSIETFFKMFE